MQKKTYFFTFVSLWLLEFPHENLAFLKINLLIFFLASKDELTQIVKEEMDRNSSLSRDLQAIRSATNTIESVQTGKLQEKVCGLKINKFL